MSKKLFLKKILTDIDEDINDSEYNVIKDLIDRIENIQKYSIREAAKNNYISTASISRLCYKFGLSGYSELKFYLKGEYDKFIRNNNENKEELKEKLYSVTDEFNYNSRKSIENIQEEELNKFLDLLFEPKGILVCGNGLSETMAIYFSQRFQMVGKMVNFLNLNSPSEMYINQLKESTALIIFSKSGETQNLQNKILIAKKNNIKIILFTSKRNSKIGRLSDIVVEIYGNKNLAFYNSNTFMFIDILVELFIERKESQGNCQ